MEKSIEKNQSSNTREHIDSQKTNRGLVSLKPKGRQREGLGANRIMRVLSTAAEQLGLAVFVAGICDKGMVEGLDTNMQELLENHVIISQETVKKFFAISHFERMDMRLDGQFKMSLRDVIGLVAGSITKAKSKSDRHESKSVDILAENVDELCKITREKLLVSEGEEKSRLEYIYNVIGRAKKSHDLILVLQKQLGEAIQNKNDTLTMLDSCIEKLALDRKTQQTNAKGEQDRLWLVTSKKITNIGESCVDDTVGLRQNVYDLQKLVQSNRKDHFEEETNLRKECYKLETEVHNWLTKYDDEMDELQKDIDEILELQVLSKPDMMIFEEKFAALNVEFQAIMKERVRKQEQMDQELAEMRAKIFAAIKIQSLWKGFKVRKMQKQKLLGKKKKRKKGGKKRKK